MSKSNVTWLANSWKKYIYISEQHFTFWIVFWGEKLNDRSSPILSSNYLNVQFHSKCSNTFKMRSILALFIQMLMSVYKTYTAVSFWIFKIYSFEMKYDWQFNKYINNASRKPHLRALRHFAQTECWIPHFSHCTVEHRQMLFPFYHFKLIA